MRPGPGSSSRSGHNSSVIDDETPLREREVDPDPLREFAIWFREAGAAGVRAPEAAAVATASADGGPSVRMVLVKGFDERGFVFYSNYASRKGRELASNPRAALLFYWEPLARQVRIEGPVERASAGESAAYARSRPRASQLSALASPQSQTVQGRQALERRVAELEARYGGAELPIPSDWGGFRLAAETFEFWQQRRDRLHDRLFYRRDEGVWLIERLAP
jgi:pyridoxamine 5'-phosphate oxidase